MTLKITLTTLLTTILLTTLTSFTTTATPLPNPPTHHLIERTPPYFHIVNFTFSHTTTSSRYQAYVSFPQYVVESPSNPNAPTYTIPGFTDPVACTGTYFSSSSSGSSSNGVTTINACGTIGDGKSKSVTTQMDVNKGDLYLSYTFTGSINGVTRNWVWSGEKDGLGSETADQHFGFDVPATETV